VLSVDKAGNKQTKGIQKPLQNTPPPSLSITTPTDNQIFPSRTTSATLNVSITNHTGTWNWKLNEPFPASGLAGGNSVKTGNAVTITGSKDGQSYTVYVALVDANGNLLSPSMTTSIKFSISNPTIEPEFSIDASEKEIIAKAEETVTYSITLEGKNGFSGNIKLSSTGLPLDVVPKFNPEIIQLSTAKSFVISMLSMTIPKDIAPNSYPFTIFADSDIGIKKLSLTLIITKEPPKDTSLSFTIIPQEAPYKCEFSREY
jgi:uncharacterized membrane protein